MMISAQVQHFPIKVALHLSPMRFCPGFPGMSKVELKMQSLLNLERFETFQKP